MSGNSKTTSRDKLRQNFAGFTVVEMVISISVLGIVIVSLMGIVTYYFANMTRNNVFAEMTSSSQNLLRAMSEEIRYGAGVRQSNTITDVNAPAGGWNTSNNDFVIVVAVPAFDSNRNYIINPDTGSPYNNEFVYFKQDDILYRRTLANPDASGNTLASTCPKNLATSSCPADTELVNYLVNMVFTLYDQDNNETSDPLLARSIKIHLAVSRDTFGSPLTLDNDLQVTLRNQF